MTVLWIPYIIISGMKRYQEGGSSLRNKRRGETDMGSRRNETKENGRR